MKKDEVIKFSLSIEKLARDKKLSIMEAVLFHCEKTGLEVESAAKMLSKHLKSKIKVEAQKLNFLEKPKTKRLPYEEKEISSGR